VSRVVDEDPLCQMWHVMRSSVLLGLGRDDTACDALQKALELDPDFWFGSAMLAVSSTRRAQHDKARQCAEKAMARAPWSPYSLGVMAGVLANLGQADEAERLLATLKNDANGGAVGLVLYWLCRDDIEAAVEWAGKAAELHFPSFITIVIRPFEPVLRQSAAWPDVLKKMNLQIRAE
jgi:tetratricopeptide (TPR) repeat protein